MSGVCTPRVVALVPTWHAADFVQRTLDAVSAQSHPNLVALVSDDASPDATASICERHARSDPRFRVIVQPRNLGWVGNTNALLALAEGEGDYLWFAFHDDLPEPEYVARCVAALEADPAAILAFSDIVLIERDGTRSEMRYTHLDGVRDRLRRARTIARQTGHWWIPNRGVFRAEAAREIGGLRLHAAGEFSADWPWLLHMSLLGKFARVPERLVTKIFQTRSLSQSWQFSARSWLAVTGAAMGAVSRARLGGRERVVLRAELAAFAAETVQRSSLRRLRRTLRALRPPGFGRPVD